MTRTVKRFFLMLLMLNIFQYCQSQNPSFSHKELLETDSALNFGITNFMYLSIYEYYYSHFQFPSSTDTLFCFMLESLSMNEKQLSLPKDIKKQLIDNKPYFRIHISQNNLLVLFRDSTYLYLDVPYTCEEFCEMGSYAGFVRNKVICNDSQANRLEKLFNHRVWKYYVRSVNKLQGQHVVSCDNQSLGYIGLTYNMQTDILVAHNLCSYEMGMFQPYYDSLHELSRHFCHKYQYDGLFFSAPFVY